MKKIIILLYMLTLASTAIGQGFQKIKLGIRFSPSVSYTRVKSDQEGFTYGKNGSALKTVFGPIVDIKMAEQYNITTGLLFAVKRVGLTKINESSGSRIDEEYKLQYLQIPVALKLYTNEIISDIKLYAIFGTELEVKLSGKINDTGVLVTKFLPYDVSLFFGGGTEYQMSINTALFAGLSYHRGLFNIVQEGQDFTAKNNLFSLDLGIKF